jgi:hypothetical protein
MIGSKGLSCGDVMTTAYQLTPSFYDKYWILKILAYTPSNLSILSHFRALIPLHTELQFRR